MSTNVVRVNGDYKIATQGGNITLDAAGTGIITLNGNLNIIGTTTSITTTDTEITDNVIVLNNGESSSHAGISLGTSGIKINRGSKSWAQILFDENLKWTDPSVTSNEQKDGVFIFSTVDGNLNGIRTNSIDTGGPSLNLVGSSLGIVTVHGTTDYERQILDYNKLTQLFTISSVARNSSNVSTIVTNEVHGFDITGNKVVYVYITCSTNATFNTIRSRVLSVTSTSFTYANVGAVVTTTPASGIVRPNVIKDDDSIPNMLAVADYADNLKIFNKVVITAPTNGATLTIADTKTLTVSNSVTFTSTDTSSTPTVSLGSGGTVAYEGTGLAKIIRAAEKLNALSATTSSELAGVISDETGSGNLVFNTSPSFITDISTSSTIFSLINSTALTVYFAGAATSISIGSGVGTTTVNNKLAVTGIIGSPNIVPGLTNTTSASTTTTLTATSDYYQNLSGSLTQNYKLPESTSLSNGHTFVINNNNTSGNITIQYNDSTSVGSVIPGANKIVTLYNNGSSNGSWDLHGFIPANASWGTSVLDTNATTFSILVAPTNLTFGYGGTSAATLNIATGSTGSGNTKTINLGTGGQTGSTTNVNVGSPNGGLITLNTQVNLTSTSSGTATISSDVTTGSVNLFTGLTTGTLNLGSAAAGKVSVAFNTDSTSATTGALVVTGGVGISKSLYLGEDTTMLFRATDPTAVSGGVTVYSKNSNLSNTGIYYVNSTTSGELVSKRKALAYSIVFG